MLTVKVILVVSMMLLMISQDKRLKKRHAEQTREKLHVDCRTAGVPHVFLTMQDVDDELMFRIICAGDPLVIKAASLTENRTSNLAECFMSLRTKIVGGKVFNRVQSDSFQHRCTAAGFRVQLTYCFYVGEGNWGQTWLYSCPNSFCH